MPISKRELDVVQGYGLELGSQENILRLWSRNQGGQRVGILRVAQMLIILASSLLSPLQRSPFRGFLQLEVTSANPSEDKQKLHLLR